MTEHQAAMQRLGEDYETKLKAERLKQSELVTQYKELEARYESLFTEYRAVCKCLRRLLK